VVVQSSRRFLSSKKSAFDNALYKYDNPVDQRDQIRKYVKVFDSKTNITNSYPSIRKAAIALNVDVKSLNRHIIRTNESGLDELYKNQYYIVKKKDIVQLLF
jgi:hypothetical protein